MCFYDHLHRPWSTNEHHSFGVSVQRLPVCSQVLPLRREFVETIFACLLMPLVFVLWKALWCFRSAYKFVSSRFARKVALPVIPKAHAQRFRLAELRFASDSWRFRSAARAPFFLLRWVSQSASVSEKTTCHVWKTVRFLNGIANGIALQPMT